MFVVAQHGISDPAIFWRRQLMAMPSMPRSLRLHFALPNPDGSRAVCIWEGESVEAVSTYVEDLVGPVSSNEYFELEGQFPIPLPSR